MDGILLIGHGTRDVEGTQEFLKLSESLAKRMSPLPVESCLLEFQHPTLTQAWRRLADAGVRNVRVAPLLLFAAGHAKGDIPQQVADCAATTPGMTFSQSGPLSRAAPIIDLSLQRIRETATKFHCPIDRSTVLVMVGRGSRDPCATSDMHVLAEVVARRLEFRQHHVAFYAMASPRVPEVLDRVAMCPQIQNVIVQPHLLFQGRLYDAIVSQVNDAALRHPAIRWLIGDYLGPSPEVVEALVQRIASDREPQR